MTARPARCARCCGLRSDNDRAGQGTRHRHRHRHADAEQGGVVSSGVAHEGGDAARCHPMSGRQIVREHRRKGEGGEGLGWLARWALGGDDLVFGIIMVRGRYVMTVAWVLIG